MRGVTGSESSCDVPLGPAIDTGASLSSACEVVLSSPKAFRSALGLIVLRADAGEPIRVEAEMLGLCAR